MTATSHYLSQYWPSSMSPYGVIRPRWVKVEKFPFYKTYLKISFAKYRAILIKTQCDFCVHGRVSESYQIVIDIEWIHPISSVCAKCILWAAVCFVHGMVEGQLRHLYGSCHSLYTELEIYCVVLWSATNWFYPYLSGLHHRHLTIILLPHYEAKLDMKNIYISLAKLSWLWIWDVVYRLRIIFWHAYLVYRLRIKFWHDYLVYVLRIICWYEYLLYRLRMIFWHYYIVYRLRIIFDIIILCIDSW